MISVITNTMTSLSDIKENHRRPVQDHTAIDLMVSEILNINHE
jgi:hypothetical protein